MNSKSLASFAIAFILFAVLSVAAYAVPVTVEKVEVDDEVVTTGDTNRLDVLRGSELPVEVTIVGTGNGSDVEIRAFISGFEHRDLSMSDATSVFDVEQGVRYRKKLSLKLPEIADEDNYLLRVFVSDRNSAEIVQSYKLKIDVPRHNLAIRDVVLNPDVVEAGRALLATVRVKNMGERDEDGIKIRVAIPELGISATDYLDELESDEATTSEELYLRIPVCAKAGDYTVRASVEFNDGFDKVTSTKNVEVEESDACVENVLERTIIMVDKEPQVVAVGGAGAVFPITINNAGTSTKVYTLAVEGADDWANVRLSPSNVVVAKGGEVKTVSLYLSPKQGATSGEHSFTVTIRDQNGNVLEQLTMRANVKSDSQSGLGLSGFRKYLEVGLVVLVVLLIVIALIFIFSKLFSGSEEEEEAEPKTYY